MFAPAPLSFYLDERLPMSRSLPSIKSLPPSQTKKHQAEQTAGAACKNFLPSRREREGDRQRTWNTEIICHDFNQL